MDIKELAVFKEAEKYLEFIDTREKSDAVDACAFAFGGERLPVAVETANTIRKLLKVIEMQREGLGNILEGAKATERHPCMTNYESHCYQSRIITQQTLDNIKKELS